MNSIFQDIAAPVGIYETSFLEANWYWIALVIFVFAALAAYLILRIKKVKKISPYELAIMRFEAAKNETDSNTYAFAISSIIRDYISIIFNIPAPERTSEEFLKLLAGNEVLDEAQKENISEILKLSDLAKFAQSGLSEDERSKMYKLAFDFIDADNKKRQEAKK